MMKIKKITAIIFSTLLMIMAPALSSFVVFATDTETETVTTREYTIRTRVGEEFEIDTVDAENITVSSDSIESTMAKSGISGAYDEDGNWVSSPVYAGWYYVAHQPGTYTITVNYKDKSQDIYTIYVTYALTEEDQELLEKLKKEWPEGVDAQREEIVKTALSGIGNITYNSGNATCTYKDPDADCLHCSQFVAWVYYQNGYDYEWCKAANIHTRDDVINVEHDEMLPGDIGSYANEDGTGHTGIYLGTIDGIDYWCHSSTSDGIDGVRAGTYSRFTYYSVYQPLMVSDDLTKDESITDEEQAEDETTETESSENMDDNEETTVEDIETDETITENTTKDSDEQEDDAVSAEEIPENSEMDTSAIITDEEESEITDETTVTTVSESEYETTEEQATDDEETATVIDLTSETDASKDDKTEDETTTVINNTNTDEIGKEDTTEYGKEDTTPVSSENTVNVSSSGNVKTGDGVNAVLWIIPGVMVAIGCMTGVVNIVRKKH